MDKYSEDSWVWKKLINLTLIGNLIVKKYLKCLVIIICYLNPCTVKDIKVWVVTDSLHAAHLCGFKDSFYNQNIKNGNDSNLGLWHCEAIEVILLNIQSLFYICIHLLRYTLYNKKILSVYQWLKSIKAR